MAMVVSAMVNLWGRKKGQRPYSPDDFMPHVATGNGATLHNQAPRPKARPTQEELAQKFIHLNKILGGKDLRVKP